jgi:hypothetical protein
VVEDDPAAGVNLQLPDGSFRRFARAEVLRVEYAGEQAAPPPPAAAPPPPMAYPTAPPQYQAPPARDPMEPAGLTLALGLGGTWSSGDVSEVYGSTSDWWGGMIDVLLEGGVRLNPATTLLLQVDLGGGDAAGAFKDACQARGMDCSASTFRIGVGARYAFSPIAKQTPWVSAGIGREGTGVNIKGSAGTEHVAFGGWEWLRLGAGYDFRFSRSFGIGPYVGLSLGTYTGVAADGPAYLLPSDLGGHRTHTWFTVGVKAILFP